MRPSSTSLAIRLTGNRAVSWPAVAAPRMAAQVLLCGAPKPARWRGGRSGPPRSKGHGSSSSSPIAGFNRRALVCGWPAAAVDYQVDTARRGSWKTWFVSFGWRCQGDRTMVAVISHADRSDRSALSRWRGACGGYRLTELGQELRSTPGCRPGLSLLSSLRAPLVL